MKSTGRPFNRLAHGPIRCGIANQIKGLGVDHHDMRMCVVGKKRPVSRRDLIEIRRAQCLFAVTSTLPHALH